MNLVAAKLPTKWHLVGLQLDLSCAKLNEIGTCYPADCQHFFSLVFFEWENQGTPRYTWKTVLDVLQTPSVEEKSVAKHIESIFTVNPDANDPAMYVSDKEGHQKVHC